MPYKDKDKARAHALQYRATHKELYKALARRYRQTHKAAEAERHRKFYLEHRAELIADSSTWQKTHPEAARAKARKWYAKSSARQTMDSTYYALCRAKSRMGYARRLILRGLIYRPSISRRIPDWAVKGGRILDFASPWLIENLTPAQRDYAMRLAIERKEWRER